MIYLGIVIGEIGARTGSGDGVKFGEGFALIYSKKAECHTDAIPGGYFPGFHALVHNFTKVAVPAHPDKICAFAPDAEGRLVYICGDA